MALVWHLRLFDLSPIYAHNILIPLGPKMCYLSIFMAIANMYSFTYYVPTLYSVVDGKDSKITKQNTLPWETV